MPSERSTKAPEKNERSRQSSKKSNGNSKKMTKSIGADGKIPDDLQRKIATYQVALLITAYHANYRLHCLSRQLNHSEKC